MDARRRGAAKVGTSASCATKQTLQLTQSDQIAPLLRDWSAFVQMKTRAVAEVFGFSAQRHRSKAQKLRSCM
jgi:hypothetical protein